MPYNILTHNYSVEPIADLPAKEKCDFPYESPTGPTVTERQR